MNYIQIVDGKAYIPKSKILNSEIENRFKFKKDFIKSRTGIEKRYYAINESIEEMAVKAVEKIDIDKLQDVEMIIVATTSSNNAMPGISNQIQKHFKITKCMCLDILAGCGGFINAIDIAKIYIETGRINKALVVGVDKLSKTIDTNDLGTMAVLADGAGAVLLQKTMKAKMYKANIEAKEDLKDILSYKIGENIKMKGKEVYKYAVTEPVDNINGLLEIANESMENIKYIIPHQSNLKILNSIAKKLKIPQDKMYINIQKIGNTFCASIPIAIAEMMENDLLQEDDKIILLGYGGGLNTGSILMEF